MALELDGGAEVLPDPGDVAKTLAWVVGKVAAIDSRTRLLERDVASMRTENSGRRTQQALATFLGTMLGAAAATAAAKMGM